MEWVEIAGSSLEEVKQAALGQLGVGEADAEIVVLSEPKTGLFGRSKGEARIRARVRPQAPRAKRGGRSGGRDRGERGGRGGRGRGDAGAAKPREPREPKAQEAKPKQARPRGEKMEPKAREDAVSEEITIERQAEVGQAFLEGLLQAFGLEATVKRRELDEDTVELSVSGSEGLGLLVGPRGSTLSALQEVTRTAIQNKLPGNRQGRLLVDVAEYRQRRAAALARFATQIAEEVIAEGEERALESMAAPDRKVVHDTVNAMDGVETRSEGEEPNRYIVIVPA